MVLIIVGYLLAGLIGLSLGLIGGGGSILAVPVLVYVMGVPAKAAIAMSLVIVGVVSLVGAIPHWRMGNVRFKTALLFGPAAMVGAYLGARLAALPWITETVQMGLFAITMLAAALLMIRKRGNPEAIALEAASHPHKHRWIWIAVEGLAVGVLTGLVGVGGGFAIVPALVLLGNVPMKQATGTSLLIIAMKSVTGFLGYLGQVTLDWPLMLGFTLAATLGMVLGVQLLPSIKAQHLQKGFGYLLFAMAGFILWQNLSP
ncbi:sulfite exporter TauE/SafE family protein [Leptolyngbya sp. CCY15150]|uniref:sulfite exporter TauE/SafE family protein n=1 Tax=Leptolyngbya sp. CCY15150 TaxID=2767772 RepID=UPI001951736F|nr:sulfite exporter TauE/SafE family protein [Leptolyngbya sp. CCY15150]